MLLIDAYRGFFETVFLMPRPWSGWTRPNPSSNQAIIQRRPGAIPAPRKLPPLEVLAPESPSHGSEQNGGEHAEDGSLGLAGRDGSSGGRWWWWIDGGVRIFFFRNPTPKKWGGFKRKMGWLSFFFSTR